MKGFDMEPKDVVVNPFDLHEIAVALEPEEITNLRMHLHSTFMDYAEQEAAEGNHFSADTWRKAASIARDSVMRRVVPL